jgi:hypothetical protein
VSSERIGLSSVTPRCSTSGKPAQKSVVFPPSIRAPDGVG